MTHNFKDIDVITLKPIKSSNIAASGYDPATQVLAIRFTGGGKVYHYQQLPAAVAAGLESAESAGRYFASEIRGKFHHNVVLDGQPA